MRKARLNGNILEIIDYVEMPVQVYTHDGHGNATIEFKGYKYQETVIYQIDLTEVLEQLKKEVSK